MTDLRTEQRLWVVIDEDGEPSYCASYSQACHDHVNEAIAMGYEEAAKWVVREATIVPPPKPDCPHAAPFRYCDGCKVSPCPIGLDGGSHGH